MHRRKFLQQSSVGAAQLALVFGGARHALSAETETAHSFTCTFAPHFGMFRHSAGSDLVDQLKFAADHGFRAWEDNGMKSRPIAEQERIAQAMERLNLQMGVISCTRGTSDKPTFTSEDAELRRRVVAQIGQVVEVAKRVNTTWLTTILGDINPRLDHDYQTALAADLLKACCDVVEPHGMTLVLEPLNRLVNHPGKFLVYSPQAYALSKAVNRPSCKILFDIYHQQISEGNLIGNIDRAWDEIAYFQVGDAPGRNEPGTGEINYANVFRHLRRRGYDGILGMEHGNAQPGREGELAVIEAYRRVDPPR